MASKQTEKPSYEGYQFKGSSTELECMRRMPHQKRPFAVERRLRHWGDGYCVTFGPEEKKVVGKGVVCWGSLNLAFGHDWFKITLAERGVGPAGVITLVRIRGPLEAEFYISGSVTPKVEFRHIGDLLVKIADSIRNNTKTITRKLAGELVAACAMGRKKLYEDTPFEKEQFDDMIASLCP